MEPYSSTVLWIVIVSFIVAFVLAFGVGANDVANSFGTSVGSRVLTLRQACILASIFEVAGSILLGYSVSETIRKGIVDTDLFANDEKELMLGSLSALVGSALWNLIATALAMPISGTHTVVGATIGYALVARGVDGVHWMELVKIIASWFISPILSGTISVVLFVLLRKVVIRAERPLRNGLLLLPILFAVTVFINVFSIVHDGSPLLRFDRIPLWGALVTAFGAGLLTAAAVQLWLVPRIRTKQSDTTTTTTPAVGAATIASVELGRGSVNSDDGKINPVFTIERAGRSVDYGTTTAAVATATEVKSTEDAAPSDDKHSTDTDSVTANSQVSLASGEPTKPAEPLEDVAGEAQLFSPLQILTACFGSFAHGGNDVSNAVGPLVAVWLIYTEGSVAQESETPIYVLAYGGLGITVGLWALGRRVMRTIGEDLTRLTPATGFTIELGAASTVLLASKIGLPVSTTHCKVGSVVTVGWARSGGGGVSWRLFGGIATAWLVTVPVSAAASAAVMAFLTAVAL
ncbi:Sodium-dependent phosphate transporter 1-A [Amphibalanus amphitrite]|uniref:Phosphate transporter n=1 Tax=Amphibalanus amphitrite TaxID=1232801 RepID=A0A6A4W5A1_AMPAM|nr:sodium-dependent phosphate transporter 2-like [Amphibalanus amphitrite]KAF0297198.1 Sodium-dependent phosphate transporter 1-A [Amphibalanus amphitrite]